MLQAGRHEARRVQHQAGVELAALAQREADAGVVLHAPGMLPAPALEHLSLGTEPLVLALPAASQLAGARRLSLPALLAQPLIIFPRAIAPSIHDAVVAFYHRHGATPVIGQEAIQMQTIVNLVSAGLGLAWVPESVTQLRRDGVLYRRLPPSLAGAAPQSETSLVWPGDAGPVVERFVRFVRASLAS